jgi:hypothetical protein
MSEDEERVKGREPHRTARKRTDGKREDGPQADMTGRGPTLVNRRMTEGAQMACAPLIRALELQPSERCTFDSGPPPSA